jgi:tRNA pseudouridine(55) synthase
MRGLLEGVIPVYKEWGKTPLEALEALRQEYPTLATVPLSYAGRLDPLAEGLMLVLIGETNKDREKYLHLDKTYEVEILFGIKTDTGDLFGIPTVEATLNPLKENVTDGYEANIKNLSRTEIESLVRSEIGSFIGRHQFPYPIYSSKTVQGKPLFQWVNEGRINEIEIPKTDVEIYSLRIIKDEEVVCGEIDSAVILQKVQKAIQEVKGDFRYSEIAESWKKVLSDEVLGGHKKFTVIKIECSCSSGTYMRVLAEEIGKKIGLFSLAYSIKRTKVGDIGVGKALE